MSNKKALWWALLAVWCGVFVAMPKAAHAGVGRDRATGQAIWDAAISGRTTNIGTDGGAWKVIGPAATSAGTAAGSAKVAGTATATVDGKKVPVNVSSGDISKDVIVSGLQGCLSGGFYGCAIGVATPFVLQWLATSSIRANPTTGAVEVVPQGNGLCYTAPCYSYRLTWSGTTFPTTWWPSADASCLTGLKFNVPSGNVTVVMGSRFTRPDGGDVCAYDYWNGQNNPATGTRSGTSSVGWSTKPRSPDSATWYPATPQSIKDALYTNNPPVGVIDELAKYGNIIWPLGNPSVTGPASIDGPKNVTQNPDGSKVTKQDKTDYTYDGPNVTRSGTTTTTTTTAPDGTTTSTTTSTTTESAGDQTAPKPEDKAPTDTGLPPVPDLYTRKYPDGMVGIWNEFKDQLKNSDFVQLASKLMPAVGNSGSCPSWPLNLSIASWADYGTRDVAPPCWIWDVAAAILVVSALLLARALVFGG